MNACWEVTRKPIVALFENVASGEQIFAIDVHMSSKWGSSSLHGSPRPPVNGAVDRRIAQVKVIAVGDPETPFIKYSKLAPGICRINSLDQRKCLDHCGW